MSAGGGGNGPASDGGRVADRPAAAERDAAPAPAHPAQRDAADRARPCPGGHAGRVAGRRRLPAPAARRSCAPWPSWSRRPGRTRSAWRCAEWQALDRWASAPRDLAECLTLQTVLIEDEKQRALARKVLAQPLQRLAMREFHKLAALVDSTPAEVEAACDRIRQFGPAPGSCFDTARTPYVTPDVIVRRGRGSTGSPRSTPRWCRACA